MKKYGVNELRQMFLDFMESKGHLVMKSFSLVPQGDKSLLLINAGMAPLKPYFTGAEKPPRTRVSTCQKCIRTGDIENVGKTARHGTFFEMLGNFSFGDYFKTEAIHWSWEFLTEVVGLDANRLYPSVYQDDDEAFDIWNKEIQEYEKVLEKVEVVGNTLPPSDFGYEICGQLKYKDKNKEEESDADEIDTYQNFIKLIKKSVFERKYSFVLKYIDIQGIELASGERALLNFFSWIYFVPKFTQIMREEKKESVLNKNILLLIDEIDLYCHPLWQQKMLAFLIDELKNQYSDKKVQIIFTTHSPIILSDIPRSNVIFLKRENDRCKIDDNRLHSETFGANIYKLFNNAFFLGQKGQIGEFSRNKIQVIINKISPKLDPEEGAVYHEISKKEAAELEKEIVLIGEPIIRNKLYDMLYKCQYCLKEPQERKLEIYRKKLQKLEEEMRHDIH